MRGVSCGSVRVSSSVYLHFRTLFLGVLLHGGLGQLAAQDLHCQDSLGHGESLVAQKLGVHAAGSAESVALGLLDACRQPQKGMQERGSWRAPEAGGGLVRTVAVGLVGLVTCCVVLLLDHR